MRATDNRYSREREKFDLVIRMIRHEARTGTIKMCTGFTDDRIRKIVATYFQRGAEALPRRRGKTPRQIGPFIKSARHQGEASLLGGLLLRTAVAAVDARGRAQIAPGKSPVTIGRQFCDAYEAYLTLHPHPQFSFEWAWNLYRSLVERQELRFAWCELCQGAYVQDAFALDYERCPFCELKDQRVTLAG